MEISRKNALLLWEAIYGDEEVISDCFGTPIYKNDYQDDTTLRQYKNDVEKHNFGWNIDHILAVSRGGNNDNNNLEPMHIENNREKGDKNVFCINGITYEVYRCKMNVDGYKGYGIIESKNRQRVDWKASYKKYF